MSAIDNSYKMDGDVLLVILFLYTLFFRFNSRSFLCIFNSSCVHCTSALCSSPLLHEEGQLSMGAPHYTLPRLVDPLPLQR